MEALAITAIIVSSVSIVSGVIAAALGLFREGRERDREAREKATFAEQSASKAADAESKRREEIEAIEERKRELNDQESEAKTGLLENTPRINALNDKAKRKRNILEDRFAQRDAEIRQQAVGDHGDRNEQFWRDTIARNATAKEDALLDLEESLERERQQIDQDYREANRLYTRVSQERERIRLRENRLNEKAPHEKK